MKKVVVFGGNGFIGSEVTTYIKNQNYQVVVCSRSSKQKAHRIDISDYAQFDSLNLTPDVIINCASQLPVDRSDSQNPERLERFFNINVIGGVNICNWAKKQGVSKIINCSTLVVNQKPWPDPLLESHSTVPTGVHAGYALSKLSQEILMNEAVKGASVDLVHLRLSAVYGPTMKPAGILFFIIDKLKRNEPIALTNAMNTVFDFIHVTDVSKTIHFLLSHQETNNVINLGSGQPISLWDLTMQLKKLLGSTSEITNSKTSEIASKAHISTLVLKEMLGKVYDSFIPLTEGLKQLIQP